MASKKKSSLSAFDEALSKPLLSSSSSRVHTRKLKLSTPPPPASSFKNSILPSSGSASSSYYSPPNTTATANSQKNPFEEDDHMSQDTIKSLNNNNNAPSNSADEQIRQELLGSDLDVELCRERAEEMVNINSSMKQINNIYKDLAVIVDSQQSNFDEIEESAMNVHERTMKGVTDLEAATKSMGSKSRWMYVLVVCAVLIVSIVIISMIMNKKETAP